MFRAASLLDDYRNFNPRQRRSNRRRCDAGRRDLGFVTLDPDGFCRAASISIDYAVMEKTERAAVLPVDCGWCDIGLWRAIWELSDKDEQGNAAHGSGVLKTHITATFRTTAPW